MNIYHRSFIIEQQAVGNKQAVGYRRKKPESGWHSHQCYSHSWLCSFSSGCKPVPLFYGSLCYQTCGLWSAACSVKIEMEQVGLRLRLRPRGALPRWESLWLGEKVGRCALQ
ncbi:MAG: hypothetical protein KAU38_08320 [Desulfobacterales bacterium]|nr:hypothetical protein [Desulfobacterales bacterium]